VRFGICPDGIFNFKSFGGPPGAVGFATITGLLAPSSFIGGGGWPAAFGGAPLLVEGCEGAPEGAGWPEGAASLGSFLTLSLILSPENIV
jgi:hypothetical protein